MEQFERKGKKGDNRVIKIGIHRDSIVEDDMFDAQGLFFPIDSMADEKSLLSSGRRRIR